MTIYTLPARALSTLVKEINGCHPHNSKLFLSNWPLWHLVEQNINKRKLIHINYNSWVDVCHRNGRAVRYHVERKVRRVSIPACKSYDSSHTEEFSYNETVWERSVLFFFNSSASQFYPTLRLRKFVMLKKPKKNFQKLFKNTPGKSTGELLSV